MHCCFSLAVLHIYRVQNPNISLNIGNNNSNTPLVNRRPRIVYVQHHERRSVENSICPSVISDGAKLTSTYLNEENELEVENTASKISDTSSTQLHSERSMNSMF